MGITKTELAEAISAAIRKEFGGNAPGAKIPGAERGYPDTALTAARGKTYREVFDKKDESLSNDGFDSFEKWFEILHSGRSDSRLNQLL